MKKTYNMQLDVLVKNVDRKAAANADMRNNLHKRAMWRGLLPLLLMLLPVAGWGQTEAQQLALLQSPLELSWSSGGGGGGNSGGIGAAARAGGGGGDRNVGYAYCLESWKEPFNGNYFCKKDRFELRVNGKDVEDWPKVFNPYEFVEIDTRWKTRNAELKWKEEGKREELLKSLSATYGKVHSFAIRVKPWTTVISEDDYKPDVPEDSRMQEWLACGGRLSAKAEAIAGENWSEKLEELAKTPLGPVWMENFIWALELAPDSLNETDREDYDKLQKKARAYLALEGRVVKLYGLPREVRKFIEEIGKHYETYFDEEDFSKKTRVIMERVGPNWEDDIVKIWKELEEVKGYVGTQKRNELKRWLRALIKPFYDLEAMYHLYLAGESANILGHPKNVEEVYKRVGEKIGVGFEANYLKAEKQRRGQSYLTSGLEPFGLTLNHIDFETFCKLDANDPRMRGLRQMRDGAVINARQTEAAKGEKLVILAGTANYKKLNEEGEEASECIKRFEEETKDNQQTRVIDLSAEMRERMQDGNIDGKGALKALLREICNDGYANWDLLLYLHSVEGEGKTRVFDFGMTESGGEVKLTQEEIENLADECGHEGRRLFISCTDNLTLTLPTICRNVGDVVEQRKEGDLVVLNSIYRNYKPVRPEDGANTSAPAGGGGSGKPPSPLGDNLPLGSPPPGSQRELHVMAFHKGKLLYSVSQILVDREDDEDEGKNN